MLAFKCIGIYFRYVMFNIIPNNIIDNITTNNYELSVARGTRAVREQCPR